MDSLDREYEARFVEKHERDEDTEFEVRRQRRIDAAEQYEAAVNAEIEQRRAA